MERVEAGRRGGDGGDRGGPGVAGEVEGPERAADGVEGERAAGEGDGAGAEGGGQEAADGDGARVDRQATRERAGGAAERERARARLGQAEGAGDGAAHGEGRVGDVQDAVAREGHATLAKVEGARTGEGDVAAEGDRVALGVDEAGGAGVVEDEGSGDGERAGAEGLGIVDLQHAGAGGDAAREGVRGAEGELGVAGLGQAAGALDDLGDDDVPRPADVQRAVQVDVVVGVAAEGQHAAGDRGIEEERAGRAGVDGEVLADAEAAVVAADLEGAAREDAAGRVVGQLAEVAAVRELVDDEAGARADGDDGGVVVGGCEDLGGAGELERAAGDGQVAGEGVGDVGQGQRARADLGDGEREAGLLGEEAGEGGVGVLAADGERAGQGVGGDRTGAGQVADRLGGGRHRQGAAGAQGDEGGVRDAVQGRVGGHADLEGVGRGGGHRHVAEEGVGGDGADGGAGRAGEGHVARAGDAGVFGAVGAVGAEGDVAVERDAVVAERAGAGDAGGGADGDGAGGAGGDDDRGGEVVAGRRAGGDHHREVARARIGVADGQRAGAGAAEVGELQRALAEDGAAGVGVVGRAAEGQRARAGLHELGVAGERVARGADQGVVLGRIGEVDQGGRQVAREGHGVDRGGVVEVDDVAVDELVGRGAHQEVVGGVVEGAVDGARPGELAETELQGQGGFADDDRRGAAVAARAGDGEEVGRRVGRAVGGDGERVEVGRTARQADRHPGRAGRVDRERAARGEGAGGDRVDDEDGVAGERGRQGGAFPAEGAGGGDVQGGVGDRTDEVQAAGDHVGRAAVGVGPAQRQRARAILIEAGSPGEGDVEVLGDAAGDGEDAAALGRDRAAAEDVLAEGKAAGGVLGVEDRARAGHGHQRVELDGGAGGGRVAEGARRPVHDAGGQVVGLDAHLLGQVHLATREVVLADGAVDGGRDAVVEDDPGGGQGAAGLVEDADAVDADVHAARLLRAAVGRGARVGVGQGQRAAAEVVGGDVVAPVRDAQVVGDGDGAAGLVDVAGHAGGVAEVQAAGPDGRAGVDVEEGVVDDGADAQDARGGVGAAEEQVDGAAVERHARADGLDLDEALGEVGEGAAGDRGDLLARQERVAVLALEAEDRLAGVAVDVEGDRAAAQRAAGGGVRGVADDQVGVRRRSAGIDPDVVQGVGADVVGAGQLDDGAVGLQAADHEVVGVVGDLDGTGQRAGVAVGGDLGVAGEGDRAGQGRATVDAEGADAAGHPELVAARIGRERRGGPQGRGGGAAAGGVGVLEARARDADVVREGRRGVEHQLTAVLDDDVRGAQLGRIGDLDAARARGGHGGIGGAEGQGAGVEGVGGRKGHVAVAARAELVRIDEDRAGARQGTRHRDAGAAADDAEGRGGRDGDEGGRHVAGAGGGELEGALVDVGRARVGVGAREGELAVAGLGQADDARAVRDRAGIIAGGEARGEVGLAEVDGEGRGGAGDAVADGRRVGVALQTHHGLAEAVEVEGGVARAAEVEHQARGQALVGAQHHGVGLGEADARGAAAAGVDDEALALAEDADGRVDVDRTGDLEGVGPGVAAEEEAALADGVEDGDATGDLGHAGAGLLQLAAAVDAEEVAGTRPEDEVVGQRDAARDEHARAAAGGEGDGAGAEGGRVVGADAEREAGRAAGDEGTARVGVRAVERGRQVGARRTLMDDLTGAVDDAVDGDVVVGEDAGAARDREVGGDGRGGVGDVEGRAVVQVVLPAGGDGRGVVELERAAVVDRDAVRGGHAARHQRGGRGRQGATGEGKRAGVDDEGAFGNRGGDDGGVVVADLGQGVAVQVEGRGAADQVDALAAADGGVAGELHVGPGVDQLGRAVVDQGAATGGTRAGEVERPAEGGVARDVGEVEGTAAGDHDRRAGEAELPRRPDADGAAVDVEPVGEGGGTGRQAEERPRQRDLGPEDVGDARAGRDAAAGDQHARLEVGGAGHVEGEVAGIVAGDDRGGDDAPVGVRAREDEEACAGLDQALALGVADDAADVELVAGDGHGREAEGPGNVDEARTGHGEVADALDGRGDRGGRRRVDVQRAAVAQGEGAVGGDRDRAAERAAVDDVLGGGDGTVAGDGEEAALDGQLTGVRQGGGREHAAEIGHARRDDVARDGGVGGVGEGADRSQGVGRDVAAIQGDDGAGERTGQQQGTRRGDGPGDGELVGDDRAAQVGEGPVHGEVQAGAQAQGAGRIQGEALGRGGGGVGDFAAEGGFAQGEGGGAGAIDRTADQDGRRGRGGQRGGGGQGGVGRDRDGVEAGVAREGRADHVDEQRAVAADLVGDDGVVLGEAEGRTGVEADGAAAQGAGVDEGERAFGDVDAAREGERLVDGEGARAGLDEAVVAGEGDDGGNAARGGRRGDVDGGQRVVRGVDQLEVGVAGGLGVGRLVQRKRPAAGGAHPAGGVDLEVGEVQFGRVGGDGQVPEDRPGVAEARVEDGRGPAGAGAVHREDADVDLAGEGRAVAEAEGVALGGVGGVGGLDVEVGAVGEGEVGGRQGALGRERAARGDVDRADRAGAEVGRALADVDRAAEGAGAGQGGVVGEVGGDDRTARGGDGTGGDVDGAEGAGAGDGAAADRDGADLRAGVHEAGADRDGDVGHGAGVEGGRGAREDDRRADRGAAGDFEGAAEDADQAPRGDDATRGDDQGTGAHRGRAGVRVHAAEGPLPGPILDEVQLARGDGGGAGGVDEREVDGVAGGRADEVEGAVELDGRGDGDGDARGLGQGADGGGRAEGDLTGVEVDARDGGAGGEGGAGDGRADDDVVDAVERDGGDALRGARHEAGGGQGDEGDGGGAAEGHGAGARGIDGRAGLVELQGAVGRGRAGADVTQRGPQGEGRARAEGGSRAGRGDAADDGGAAEQGRDGGEVVVRPGQGRRARAEDLQAGDAGAVVGELGVEDHVAGAAHDERAGAAADVVLDRPGRADVADGQGGAGEGLDGVAATLREDADVAEPAVGAVGRAEGHLVAEVGEIGAGDVAAAGEAQGLGVVDGDVVAQFEDGDGLVGGRVVDDDGRAGGAERLGVLQADDAEEVVVGAHREGAEGVGAGKDEATPAARVLDVRAVGAGVRGAAREGQGVGREVDGTADAESLGAAQGDGAGRRAGEVAGAEVEGAGAAEGEVVVEVDGGAAGDDDRGAGEVVEGGGSRQGERAGAEGVGVVDAEAARGGHGDFARERGVVPAQLDEVGGAVEVEAGRTAEGAGEDDRTTGRVDVDDVAGGRAEGARAGPGAGGAAEVGEGGAVVQREGRGDRAGAEGAEAGARADGGRDGGADVGILEADRAARDREVEVRDAAAEVDLAAADLGQGVGLAGGGGDRAIGFGTLDAADVEAAAVAAEGGVGGEGQVVDADGGVGGGAVGVGQGRVGGGAIAGAGEDDVEAAGAVHDVAVVGVVEVERAAGEDGDRGAAAEGGAGAEDEAAGLDGDAAGVEAVALDGEGAGADLAQAEAGDAVVEVRGEGAARVTDAEGQGRRGGAVVDDLEAGVAADDALGEAEAVEVEHARVERERAGVRAEGAGGRVGGGGAEAEAARVHDGGAGVGVRAGDGDLARAIGGQAARAGDDVGEGEVVHAVQAEGRARGDGDVTDERTDVAVGADVQGAAGDGGAAGVGGGGGEVEGARAVLLEAELAGAGAGAVDELAEEGAGAVAAVGVAADGEGGDARAVVGDGTRDGRGVGDEGADDAVAAVEVEQAAVELQLHGEVQLVEAGAAELEDAAVDGAGAAEGVDRRGRGLGEDDLAGVEHEGDGVVVDGVLGGAEGQRTGAVLGDRAAAGLGREGDVARTAHVVGTAAGDAAEDGRRGGGGVDEGAAATHAVAADRGEGFAGGLAVQVDGGAGGDGAARGDGAQGGRGP